MTTFSDFAFYKGEFHGFLDEDAYNASVATAYYEILSQTNSAALKAPDSMTEAVKVCECELVDVIDAYKTGAAMLPKGVSSVSNDGYSISSKTSSGADCGDTLDMERRERHTICVRYLQTPVNLMCRWV